MAEFDNFPFTNIDDEEFVGKWSGEEYPIKPGETVYKPEFLVEHFCQHLAGKIADKRLNKALMENPKLLPIEQSRIFNDREGFIAQMKMVRAAAIPVPAEAVEEPKKEIHKKKKVVN